MAEPGVANSEVTYSADGQTFTEIGPEGFAPRSNDGVVVRPGGRPNTKTTIIRHSTTNVQNLDVVIGLGLGPTLVGIGTAAALAGRRRRA